MNKKEYNYIWYLLTCFVAKEKENINFRISKNISPYFELNLENLNNIEYEVDNSKIKILDIDVNPFIRFNGIFDSIIKPDYENEDLSIKNLMSNIILHFLGELDLYLGQCRKDIIVKEIIKDIENNCMGKDIRDNFNLFKRYEKRIIGDVLYSMYTNLDMIEAFKKVVKLLYIDSIIYDNRFSGTNIVIYLNYKEKENDRKIEFIKKLFLPMGIETDIFWEKHFGVIGVPVTMIIGEIAIF
ncbi:hypothetical protein [Fusobacterium sp. PH5-44]|uniref:hypothetical protein n=1 Tax=unclassified Fusobacterium TaxID=2648384 RepID=UPI003D1D9746